VLVITLATPTNDTRPDEAAQPVLASDADILRYKIPGTRGRRKKREEGENRRKENIIQESVKAITAVLI
jgi:hypothetical protein